MEQKDISLTMSDTEPPYNLQFNRTWAEYIKKQGKFFLGKKDLENLKDPYLLPPKKNQPFSLPLKEDPTLKTTGERIETVNKMLGLTRQAVEIFLLDPVGYGLSPIHAQKMHAILAAHMTATEILQDGEVLDFLGQMLKVTGFRLDQVQSESFQLKSKEKAVKEYKDLYELINGTWVLSKGDTQLLLEDRIIRE